MFASTDLNFRTADVLPASLRRRDEHVPATASEVEQRASDLGAEWSEQERSHRRQLADQKLAMLLSSISPSIGA